MLKALLILIFTRPFICSLAFPYANSIYSILLLGFLCIWITRKGIPLNEIKPIKYPLILFITAIFISVVFSVDRIVSIKELYKYASGILLFLIGVSLSYKDKDKVIQCILVGGFLMSILAIYQYFWGFGHISKYITEHGINEPFTLDYVSRRRPFFPFVTPNTLAGYLVMVIPLALTEKHRNWLLLPLSFALIVTQSLGALISLFFGMVIYFYLCRASCNLQSSLKRKLIFLFGLLIIMGVVFFIRTVTHKQHLQPIYSTEMRLNYWKETLKIIKTSPLTGVGLGNFDIVQSRYAHDSYLQIWSEIGILGLFSFLWLIIFIFRYGLKTIRNSLYKNQIISLITASSVFLIHNLLDFSFFLPEVSLIWWVILGLIL